MRLLPATLAMVLLTAGCQTGTTTTPTTVVVSSVLQQAASDASLIATGLAAGLAPLATSPGVSQDAARNLAADLTTIAAGAAVVEQVAETGASPSAATVQSISSAVNNIQSLVLPEVPAAAQYEPLVSAALTLLPGLLESAGVVGAAQAAAPKMTTGEARLILAAVARK